MEQKTTIALVIVAILLVSSVGVVMFMQGQDEAAPIDMVRIGVMGDPVESTSPGSNYDSYRTYIVSESLVRLNPQGEFVGGIAKSWTVSADAKTWTFTLKDNATWHDGTPVTAGDVKYTLESYHKELGGGNWKVIESVDVLDERTARINLNKTHGGFLTNLIQMRTAPKHILEPAAGNLKTFKGEGVAVGCGPYAFESIDLNAKTMTLRAHEEYHGGKLNVEKIQFRYYGSDDTLMIALKKGDVDTIWKYADGVDPIYLNDLKATEGISLMKIKNIGVPSALWFDTSDDGLFKDKALREAVSYAIDYGGLRTYVGGEYSYAPKAGFLTPHNLYYYDGTRALTFDLDLAKQKLDALGYVDKNGDGFRDKPDGSEFKPTVMVRNRPSEVRVGELLKTYFNNAGIDVTMKVVESGSYWSTVQTAGSFDAMTWGTTPWGMMMDAGFSSGYPGVDGNNYSRINDDVFNDIVGRLAVESDQKKIKGLAKELQEYYADYLPVIGLYNRDNIQPCGDRFTGYQVSPIAGVLCVETFQNLKVAA